jgi:hypothetical protein
MKDSELLKCLVHIIKRIDNTEYYSAIAAGAPPPPDKKFEENLDFLFNLEEKIQLWESDGN